MKKNLLVLISIVAFTMIFISCGNSMDDADIKMEAEKAMKADPMAANLSVDVKDGVATITGECRDNECRLRCAKLVDDVIGVKLVANNTTIARIKKGPEAPMTDEVLKEKLYEISKDISTIKIGAVDGVVAVAGNLTRAEWTKLKESIDKLSPKGYDTASLRIE